MKRVIVGLDPGATIGLALLSFYNELIFLTSKKGMSDDEIEKIILAHGNPVIIATDVPKVPDKIERLARQLGAVVFSPPKEIPENEKDRIMRMYNIKTDDHARDALVAAYLAYQFYKPKIDKVIRRLSDREFIEGIIEKVIRGNQTAKSVQEEFQEERREVIRERIRRRDSKEIVELRRRIGELLEEKRKLQRKIRELEIRKAAKSEGEVISILEAEIFRLRKERDEKSRLIKDLEGRINRLERELSQLRDILNKIRVGVRNGLIIGNKERIEGEEILPGVYMGKERKSPEEKIKELINEYREERRKELNIL